MKLLTQRDIVNIQIEANYMHFLEYFSIQQFYSFFPQLRKKKYSFVIIPWCFLLYIAINRTMSICTCNTIGIIGGGGNHY